MNTNESFVSSEFDKRRTENASKAQTAYRHYKEFKQSEREKQEHDYESALNYARQVKADDERLTANLERGIKKLEV